MDNQGQVTTFGRSTGSAHQEQSIRLPEQEQREIQTDPVALPPSTTLLLLP